MRTNQPSLTAQRAALLRAAHQVLDNPRVFEDPIAVKIIGKQNLSKIYSASDKYKTPYVSHLRAFLIARSQYAESALAEAIKRGVCQYVILGAGLDTFSYRNPYRTEDLRIFEVDHPSTQSWKRERLAAEGIPVPESLQFVSMDFEKETLESQLPNAGFRTDEPSFFSWLGVTMYLPREAVMTTLKSVALLAARASEVVFDYSLSHSLLDPAALQRFQARAAAVAAAGEPWKSSFEPAQLAASLRSIGLTVEEDLGQDEINSRFFSDRNDALRVGGRTHLMKAAAL